MKPRCVRGCAPSGGSGKSPSLLFPAPVVPCRLGAAWFAATSRHPATFPLRGRPRPAPPLTGTPAVGIRDHPNPVRPRLNSITSAKTLIPDQVRPPGTGTLWGHHSADGGGRGRPRHLRCACCSRPGLCLRRFREPLGAGVVLRTAAGEHSVLVWLVTSGTRQS